MHRIKYTATTVLLVLQCCSLVAGRVSGESPISSLSKPSPLSTCKIDSSDADKTYTLGCVTWNLAERSPTSHDMAFVRSLQANDFIAIGVQECERIRLTAGEGPRSKHWRGLLGGAVGPNFKVIGHHKFGGMLLSLFASHRVAEEVDGIQIVDVACGVGNILPNKGAIAFVVRMHNTSLCVVNAHLAAHRNKLKERNAAFHRIRQELYRVVVREWMTAPGPGSYRSIEGQQTLHGQLEPVWGPDPVVMHDHSFAQESNGWGDSDADEWADGDDDDDDDDDVASESWPFDMTIFMGDLNYRVNLSRRTMARFMKPQQMEARDRTLHGQHSTVRANARGGGMEPILSATRVPADQRHSLEKVLRRDQLISQMENAVAFAGFNEGPITFYPTYKYDIRSGLLDSSEKRRCPSWPDRILFYRRWVKPVSSGSKAAHSGQIAVQPGDTEEVLEKEEDRVATPQTAGGNLIDLLEYGSVDVTHSDHRPVIAIFKLKFV